MPTIARRFFFVAALLCAARASAQMPSASTAALGMGENYTALARGYNAVAWNPALLGLYGNPRTSLTLVPVRIVAGLDPVKLADFADFQNKVVPDAVKVTAEINRRVLAELSRTEQANLLDAIEELISDLKRLPS